MKQTHKTTEIIPEKISASTCNLTPDDYSIGIDTIKKLPYGGKQQPVLKSREELLATMGDDPFWTAAVQWALRRGFWAVKEEARV